MLQLTVAGYKDLKSIVQSAFNFSPHGERNASRLLPSGNVGHVVSIGQMKWEGKGSFSSVII